MTRRRKISTHGSRLQILLNQANRKATAELRRTVSTQHLPVEFWRMLEVLADERGRSVSELADLAGMQMSATSKLVDRMAEAALLQRSADPADQRRVILHISDFGLQKVSALKGEVRRHRDRICETFGLERQAQLTELLQDFILAHR